MTTEDGIQDCKFEEPPPTLWIPSSVAFRLSLLFFYKFRVDRPPSGGAFLNVFPLVLG